MAFCTVGSPFQSMFFLIYLPPRDLVFLVTISEIYSQIYGQSTGIAGLHYVALGIGLTGSSQVDGSSSFFNLLQTDLNFLIRSILDS